MQSRGDLDDGYKFLDEAPGQNTVNHDGIMHKYIISSPLSSDRADPCRNPQASIDLGVPVRALGICMVPAQCQCPRAIHACTRYCNCPLGLVVTSPAVQSMWPLAVRSASGDGSSTSDHRTGGRCIIPRPSSHGMVQQMASVPSRYVACEPEPGPQW